MVAFKKTRRVVCTVIHVPVNAAMEMDTLTAERPSNRLPWSDPTIARLVANLQDEVRGERRQAKLAWRTNSAPVADLDPPTPASDGDWEWREEPRWTWPQ
ncbi:MAG: hypothetical protein SH868_10620 [Bythopirellula sp.]|nr:hypothetical protein [Bythopirellula sp.]